MPELPEVETIVRGLKNTIIPCKIKDIIKSDYTLRINYPSDFVKSLLGVEITGVNRISKYIVFATNTHNNIVIHLGMSGRLLLTDSSPTMQQNKHDHVVFILSNGKSLTYNDPRRFGLITLIQSDKINMHPLFKDLGVDPFSKEFTPKYLKSKAENKNTAAKSFLMNAKIITGVGNIYANETLHSAKISPFKKVRDLDDLEIKNIILSIQKVLEKAIEMGGSSLRDYVAPNGIFGNFQNNFQVYNRANKPCFSCGGHIVRKLFQQRATFYCSKCQSDT